MNLFTSRCNPSFRVINYWLLKIVKIMPWYQVWPLPRGSFAGNIGAIESLGLCDGAALQAVARRRIRGSRQPKHRDGKESEADLCQREVKFY